MNRSSISAVGLTTLLFSSMIASSAWANRALAASGEYRARHTATGHIEGLELAGGVVGARLEFDVHVQNERGGGFLHGATGHCIGVALFETESPTSSGVCSFEDADGDVLFMQFSEDSFTSSGTAESIGGTGKYAHLEVKQTHRTNDWEQIAGSRFEANGIRTGTWRVREAATARRPGGARPASAGRRPSPAR